MRSYYRLLGLALSVITTNNFVWFALTFWIYLETRSVVSTSVIAGIWLIASSLSGIWMGSLVDNHNKKVVMFVSSVATLTSFLSGFVLFKFQGGSTFSDISNPYLWLFALLLLIGVISGNIYQIAVPTLVPLIVPKDRQDKANGMFGTVTGIAFAITSVASGLVLAYLGMIWVLMISVVMTLLSIIYLTTINIPGRVVHKDEKEVSRKVDLKGTIKVVKEVPGLFGLIFFTTFNNFLGGVFMSLMDAYGLTLVSVQVWGLLWGVLSFAFIFGGVYISKKGLGSSPLKTLFTINIILWIDCIFFTIQPSLILLFIGMLVWMSLVPFLEATEQTVLQKVVPQDRLGRVIGFAHSIEQAASPITAFMIGPIAQYIFIPFMTDGVGTELIGSWFGTGPGRGIALVFILAGFAGLMVTLYARRTKSFYLLIKHYGGKNN